MDYSHIDISKFGWSDYIKRDYHLAMQYLKSQHFQECEWAEDAFTLLCDGGMITVEIHERSMIGMVCSAGELTNVFSFGDAKYQISQLKRMIEASK